MEDINSTVAYGNTTSPQPYTRGWSFAVAISHPKTAMVSLILFIIMVLIIGGNIIIIRTVFVCRRLHFSAFYFVASLAVADFIVGVFLLPFSLGYTIMGDMRGGDWSFDPMLCHAVLLCNFWFCSASILSLCVITWDRYVGVTSPLFYRVRMNTRKVRWLIAMVWLTSFSMAVLIEIAVANSDSVIYCTASGLAPEFSIPSALCVFGLPLVFLIFANGKILMIAREQRKKILQQMPASYSLSSSDTQPQTQEDSRSEVSFSTNYTENSQGALRDRSQTANSDDRGRSFSKRDRSDTKTRNIIKYFVHFRREVRTLKLFIIITGVFAICWTPLFATMVITSFKNTFEMSALMHNMLVLGYANSACNVFIYGRFNRDFRKAVYKSVKSCFPCCCNREEHLPKRVRTISEREYNNSKTAAQRPSNAVSVQTETSVAHITTL